MTTICDNPYFTSCSTEYTGAPLRRLPLEVLPNLTKAWFVDIFVDIVL